MTAWEPLVLVVSQFSSVHVGGAERYIHETTLRLQERGMRLEMLSTDGNDLPVNISPPSPLFLGYFNSRWSREVDKLFAEFSPDVVYAHFTVPGLVDVAVRCAVRRCVPVCLVYHSDVTGPQWYKKALGRTYHNMVGRKTLEGAQVLLANNSRHMEWLASLSESIREVRRAPPGADVEMTLGNHDGEGRYFLFVGNCAERNKGFAILYAAWARIRKDYPEVQLVAVGSGSSAKFPGVRFLGRIESRRWLADLYTSAMATVLPSASTESFGLVLAEALLAGCPIVGSRLEGISELIDHGINGYLVKPGCVHDLEDALREVLTNNSALRSNINDKKEEYLQRFDWTRTTDIVQRALTGCIEGNSSTSGIAR